MRPSVLPAWLAPWLPSVSLIRWFSQGLTINEYKGNTDAFPVVSVDVHAMSEGVGEVRLYVFQLFASL